MKYVFLFAFVAILVTIGVLSRKKVNNIEDFFLGGRKVGPWISAFSYGASYFSAVIFIGYAGKIGWDFGISAVWIGVLNALVGTYLAWTVLAKKTREVTHKLGSKTMPDFFEKRYGSKNMKIFSAMLIFIFLVPYSASVYKGLGYLFESAFNIPFIYCTLGMALLTGLYIMLGGYMATALNDFIQGLVMIFGVVIMVAYILSSPEAGGLTNAIKTLAEVDSAKASIFGPDPISLFGLVILTSLGTWGLPQMVHKFYTIKDSKKSIHTGKIISTIFALVVGVCAYGTGSLSSLFFNTVPDGGNYDKIVPLMLTQSAVPEIILGLITVLVLSASMSTLASLVLVSGSAITMDLAKGVIYKNMSKKFEMNLMRVICIVFVASSFIISVTNSNAIVTLMSLSWGALSGCFIAPFLYGLWSKKASPKGAWAAMLTGLTVMFVCTIIIPKIGGSSTGILKILSATPNAGSLAMILSLIVMPIVDRLKSNESIIVTNTIELKKV